MRLIDANALLENQPKDCCRTSDWINTAPTIDAIPVEWLIQRMLRSDDESDMEMRDCISVLVDEYQKEQEAK